MKKIKLLMGALLVSSMVLSGCQTAKKASTTPSAGAAQASSKELVVCVGPEPATIDPALNSSVDGASLIIHAFEGLTTLDKDGTPVLGQAESYEVSADGLTYTFKLRKDLKWSDGTPLTAKEFIYSWNRAIAPETAADYEYMFDVIKGYEEKQLAVTAPDDQTLVVELNAACPYFLELCAFPAYAPVREDLITANGEKWAIESATYVGNGPYQLKEWVHNSYMLYEKNPNYWNKDAVVSETIKFVLMDDDNALLAAFENNELSFIDSMPQNEIDAWREKPEFNLEGQLGTYYVSYQVQKEPLNNPLVRQALTLAIDREFIVKEIGKSGQVPAGGFVPIGLSDADPTKEFRVEGKDYYDPYAYEENLKKAKELLAEAGYPNGEGLPTIEYLYNTGTGHQQIGEALQNMWQTGLGVNVELVSQEWGTFLTTRKSGDYFIARNGWLADYNDPISFLDMWVTGGGNNDAQWSNPEFDALISKVKASSDREERMKLMHEAEDIMFDEWLLCPIYYYVDLYLLNQNVEGFYSSPLGFKYFMYASVK